MDRRAFLKSVIAVPLAAVGLSQSPCVPRYYEASTSASEAVASRIVGALADQQALLDLLKRDMEEASGLMHHQLMQELYGG